jgi:hypothetical protein
MQTGFERLSLRASSGRLSVIKLLIARDVPMEEKNMYGGTCLKQAMWSAVNEYAPDHAAIVEALVEAGAIVDGGYRECGEKQNVPDAATKERIAEILKRHKEFHQKISAAEQAVAEAEQSSNKRAFADALKHLGISSDGRHSQEMLQMLCMSAQQICIENSACRWKRRGSNVTSASIMNTPSVLPKPNNFYGEALELYRAHASTTLIMQTPYAIPP